MKAIKIFILFLLNIYGTIAQVSLSEFDDLNAAIPLDPMVTKGELVNGMNYYILPNAKPKGKAELRLVLNAGSTLEDDDQQGFAHFVEHMAFNGTKSFPKNKLIDYLQRIGVEFGADLNAHTGYDETVYKLSVPTDNDSIFNTSLQILREWADGISFTGKEIDNERGIIAEELRARSGAGMRLYYQSIPVLTNNSRYAERLPIGKSDIILKGKHKALKRFYEDWYRPDLMALVIVGDVDVEETQQKIEAYFNSMKKVNNPKERIYYPIPDNKEPKVVILTDKEESKNTFSVYYKKPRVSLKTLADYKNNLVISLYIGMLNQRLAEIAEKEDAPFISARTGYGYFLSDKSSYTLNVNLLEDRIEQGIEALLTENERARRFGFTDTELERYKAYVLNNAEMVYKETGKLSSTFYVEQLIDNFTHGRPYPGSALNFEFYKEILPQISLEEINAVGNTLLTEDNIAIAIKATEKESIHLPSEQWVLHTFTSVTSVPMEPYQDQLSDTKLMETSPSPGTIVKTTYNETVNLTTWQLSNGITVLAKPTQLQNNLIAMVGFRPGGSSLAPDSLYISARNSGIIIGKSGINGISSTDLKKLTMGETVSIRPAINYYEELMNGTSSTKSLEKLLQMTHLSFTAPNKDQGIFEATKKSMMSFAKGMENNPGAFFDDEVTKIMTGNHLRAISLTADQIHEGLILEQSYQFYKDRFASANGFTFIFVGNFELDTLQKLTELYLASLPSDLTHKSMWKDIGLRYTSGKIKKTFVKGMDNKSTVDLRFTGTLDYDEEKKDKISFLAKLLKIKLTEELREKMAGVYGVRVSGFATDKPYQWYRLNVQFTCDPDNVNALIAVVHKEIDRLKTYGPTETDLNKIKKAALENERVLLKYNGNWAYKLKGMIENNKAPEDLLHYETSIEKLTIEEFKKAANTYFDNENYAEFVLMPEATK